jgi:hypothetical protein
VFKFMMLSPQDVHIPTAEWEHRRGKKKATLSKTGSMRNIMPGTQGELKYQKSLAELPGIGEKPLNAKITRRARRLKQHLEGVEDYEQNIVRWDAAKAGNKEFSDMRIGMVRAGMGTKSKKRQKKVKEWLDNMRASENYKFEYKHRLTGEAYTPEESERLRKAKIRGAIIGGTLNATPGIHSVMRKYGPKMGSAIIVANAGLGALVGSGVGSAVEHHRVQDESIKRKMLKKITDPATPVAASLEDIIQEAIMLGEAICLEGIDAAVEKPAGKFKRAANWVQNAGHRAKQAAFSRVGNVVSRGRTMIQDVRSRLVKKQPGSGTLVPIQHVTQGSVMH